jgi:hypothetical protein
MPLTWQPGWLFTGLAGCPDRDGSRRAAALARALALSLLAGVLVIIPVAYAGSPDPIWIAGLYDNSDEDEAIARLADGTVAGGTRRPATGADGLGRCGVSEDRCHTSRGMSRAEMIRGQPPIEPRRQFAPTYGLAIGCPRHDWPLLIRAPPTFSLAADTLP